MDLPSTLFFPPICHVTQLDDLWGCGYKRQLKEIVFHGYGGGGGIRTLDELSPMPVFKTGAFNRSATPPQSRDKSAN